MKPAEQAQVDFIKDLLRKGEQRKAILAKFGEKWRKTASRTFDRRHKVAVTEVQAEQKRIQAEAEGNVAKEVEALQSKIMGVVERQFILSEMARGELETEVLLVTKDGIKKAKAKPTHSERRAAIAELSKMDGAYAAAKTEGKLEIVKGIEEIEIVHTTK